MVSSLVGLLRVRAGSPSHNGYTFLEEGEPGASLSFSELDQRARALAAQLQSRGLAGERALLLFPPGLQFISAFFGCLYAQVVAVPAIPPHPSRLQRTLPRLLAIVDSARPAVVVTTSAIAMLAKELPETLASLPWIALDEVERSLAESWVEPLVGLGDIAFLQYTSGSTAAPKGVMVSHGNLLHNLSAIQSSCELTASDVSVTWLPSFHDMGLIDGILEPLLLDCPAYVMSPAAFMQRPVRWLQAITRYGGTHSGAPNFAYDLCVQRVKSAEIGELDLSTWRSAYCGAEPVRDETLRRFAEVFAPCRFRATSLYPCFGLAEGTLIVSGSTAGQGAVVRRVATEALQRTQVREPGPGEAGQVLVSSGRALAGTRCVIVEPETGYRCAPDEVGEIWVHGPSVAQGYWGLPEETERTFGAWLEEPPDGPFLRTGDLGFLSGGELFVTGRSKDLIIIRGENHYPQDIELTVERSHPSLRPGCGAAFSVEIDGQERLVVVQEIERESRSANIAPIAAAACIAVAEQHDLQLHALCLLKPGSVPKTSSGKIQRSACRRGFLAGSLSTVSEWRAPAASPQLRPEERPVGERLVGRAEAIRGWLTSRIAQRLGIEPGAIDAGEPFARYGIDSAAAAAIVGELEEWLGASLSATLLYERPTIAAVAAHLAGDPDPRDLAGPAPVESREPVAVIGIGCRFPGAGDPAVFWRLLRDGVDAVTEVPASRWDLRTLYDPDPAAPGRMSSRWGGFLERIDEFDAPLFGISPREAERMDPQQRLLLEVAWETLEDAGLAPEGLCGSATGVFVGISAADYSRLQLGDLARVDAYAGTGNALSIAANRVSYFFDFQGPSLAVDTACSSALVALHLACQSLADGECGLALAGGVNLVLDPATTVVFSQAGLLAPDGRCKVFDSRADGYVRSEGCGFVLLKPLSRALADGDAIYAVIRGSAVNQDGRSNGLTAPNPRAQTAVIREAYRRAGVSPGRVEYVETHGTGTALGDPIEAAALGAALAVDRPVDRWCAIGSVKSNLGHLEAAAGIAGLIKVALALRHGEIPPSLHFREPNPHIAFAELPLRVQRQLAPWPEGAEPAIAGVSSFGFGGTNAHVVLEEAPARQPVSASRPWEVLLLSARTPAALDTASARLAEHLRQNPGLELADVACTLQAGRRRFDHRRTVLACGTADAAAALAQRDPQRVFSHRKEPGDRQVAFLLPGLGDHYPNMAAGLYRDEPAFREEIDCCAEILAPHLGLDVREVIFTGGEEAADPAGGLDLRSLLGRAPAAPGRLDETALAQPAVFAVDYALARLWMRWGVAPVAMIGYSLGEYVAACLAGVFSLEEGLALVANRARWIQELPAGGMLAVALPEAEALGLADGLSVAAVNGPATCLLAGPMAAVEALQRRLDERGAAWRRLRTTHAFHSPMMEPVRAALVRRMEGMELRPPRIPYLSNVTGGWITAEQATDPGYWGDHLCSAVRFGDGIAELLRDPRRVFLEVGPGQTLASLVRLHPACEPNRAAVSSLRSEPYRQPDSAVLLGSAGKLWLTGVELDWQACHSQRRPRLSLPTYPFERQRYWLDIAPPVGEASVLVGPGVKRPDPADWYFLPVWRPVPAAGPALPLAQGRAWLVFLAPDAGLGEALLRRLRQEGQRAVGVFPGERFGRSGEDLYAIDPGSREDYQALLAELRGRGPLPDHIVHLWGVTGAGGRGQTANGEPQRLGFYSLLYLAQALIGAGLPEPADLTVVTDGMQRVTGREELCPLKATVLGLCRVIPQEHPSLRCRSLDVELEPGAAAGDLAGRLLAELMQPAGEPVVAWRGGERWVQGFEPLRLEVPAEPSPALRPNGVYLITGGMGGIGRILAGSLARSVGARLVLTGRSELPERERWDAWLETHVPHDAASRTIRSLRELEEMGAEVFPLRADVADPERMRAVVRLTRERFGALHGVIHAAGIVSPRAFRPVADAAPADCEVHFRPKVDGLLVLDEVLQGVDLDFCLLLSSISSVLGGLGFSAYAAANAFLDAFADSRQDGRRWLSVDWDGWHAADEFAERAAAAGYDMSAEEGAEAFQRVLASGRSGRLVHSTGDLEERIARWVRAEEVGGAERREPAPPAVALHGRPVMQGAYVPAQSELEQRIAELWQQALGMSQVGIHDNFFDLGGNSLIGVQLTAELRRELGVQISNMTLFEAPTVSALARCLGQTGATAATAMAATEADRRAWTLAGPAPRPPPGEREIALIGMAGRFPGAAGIEELWHNLREGVESISFFSNEELLASGIDAVALASPDYVKARPILGEIESFDAHFFGYSPREAALMDPQHRIFMECAWHALEDAGYDPRRHVAPIGLFAGCSLSTYLLSLYGDPAISGALDPYQMVIGNDKDSMPTAVSYKLDLKGPSIAVQTHCSTSLVATHLACQSLLVGECDMAMAGGVSVRVPQRFGYRYQEGGQESPDGHCRSFDAAAGGTVFGDGVGIVVLKRLADALADGDTIHAVIKGSAINNDGSLKIGYTAPSIEGQARAVQRALTNAEVDPATIGYVEGHGSATRLGDPIEVAALTRAFRYGTSRTGFCALGSVKSNVGHLDRAAGVTGLIKTVLALEHATIPATLHFREPSPEIDFAASPFYVNAETRPWPSDGSPRRAGVNSLGMGGTNAHLVLEEAPATAPSGPSRAWQLLVLSARTEDALAAASASLAGHLSRHGTASLADAAYTLQVGRCPFEHRRAVLADSVEGAVAALQTLDARRVFTGFRAPGERPVAFLFPGLGDHYVDMGRELYRSEAGFRERVDRCCEILRPYLGLDLRTVLYPEPDGAAPAAPPGLDLRRLVGRSRGGEPAGRDPLGQTALSQPAVFTVDYALAGLWMDWGVRPWALMGYSLGEYVAACLSGVLSLEDALALVARRGRLIQELPAGAMLAVPLTEREARDHLSGALSLAAVNGPSICVVSGPVEEVEALERRLAARGATSQRLQATHAFHSTLLEPIRETVAGIARGMELRPPLIPFLSNLTGRWITAEQATDPAYWAAHMCETVRFEDGVQELLRSGSALLEVGPGQALTSAALQRREGDDGSERVALPSLRHRHDGQPDTAVLLATLGKLWLAGVEVDWTAFHAGERRRRVRLPAYPFERRRYWIDAQRPPAVAEPEPVAVKQSNLASWFYTPEWRRAPRAPRSGGESGEGSWLVFADARGLGDLLATNLRETGSRVVTVRPGEAFLRIREGSYTLRPSSPGDYEELLKHLRVSGWPPADIAFLWSLDTPQGAPEDVEVALEHGFYSLLFLAQAIGHQGYGDPLRIHAVSGNACDVVGGDLLHPLQATLLGPCRVIPQEYPNVSCRMIDVDLAGVSGGWEGVADELVAEMTAAMTQDRVAYRGRYRWMQSFEPMPLLPAPARPTRLRDRGVYLITGGLGGLGLAIAEHLVQTVRARLVLVSRSPFPAREEWAAWRIRHGAADSTSERIGRLEELESLGAEILVASCDVTDRVGLAEVIERAKARFGGIQGVVHAAGVPGEGLIQRKERSQAAAVLSPKVRGTLVLNELLRTEAVDFLVLFSSSSSITGGLGEVDYCAANAFLDAFSHSLAGQAAAFTIAINWGPWQWDAWQDTLLQGLPEVREQVRQMRSEFGISFEEGRHAFARVLDGQHRQVAVLTQGLAALVAQARGLTTESFLDSLDKARSARPRFTRPNLKNPFVAPTGAVERELAEVFQDLLGVDQVGVHDAFFELGGNSLIGLQLVARVQKKLEVQLTIADLFAAPTVRSLAAVIGRPAEEAPPFDASRDRGRLRRQKRSRPKAALPPAAVEVA
jgi:acyl transferase domain-containing protein/acyl-CoA synthetase (AMP-forming)/AMP-acid ligase II/acyl carrier protein